MVALRRYIFYQHSDNFKSRSGFLKTSQSAWGNVHTLFQCYPFIHCESIKVLTRLTNIPGEILDYKNIVDD